MSSADPSDLPTRLDKLQVSFEQMEDWELVEFIQNVRVERKTKKAKARSSGPRPKDKAKKQLKDLLSQMSKEQKLKLLGGK